MENEEGEDLELLPMETEPQPTSPPPTQNGAVPPPPREEGSAKQPEEAAFVSASESLSESEQNPKTEEDEDDVAEEEPNGDGEEDENGNPRPGKKPKPLPVKEEEERQEGVAEAKPETASPPKPKPKPKKKKKKTLNSVWMTRSTRKGKKKTKPTPQGGGAPAEDKVLITPVPRFFDKGDDSPEAAVCLSKVYKAEKVELSEDRMSAGSSKGYRMVRATRGVCEGAWYFEIRVVRLGDTGHTRLGWSTEKGDLQAPVGYDANSFGYRDVDGSKVHKALREKYGEEGYKEGDVLGFYINLPEGGSFAPKPPQLVWYKGQRYLCAQDPKEEPPKIIPGSEISFFKNGVCQGVAFKDLYGGRYYPAASMYTLPCQPNCEVKFNFGPDFEFFPEDFDGRSVPRPMVEAPYHGYDCRAENGTSDEK